MSARARVRARQSACATGCLLFLLIRTSGEKDTRRRGLGRTSQVAMGVPTSREKERRDAARSKQRRKRTAANKKIHPSVRFFICFTRMLRRSPSPVSQYHAPSLVNLFGAAALSPIVLLREEGVRTYSTRFILLRSAPRRAASLAVLFYYARHARWYIALCHCAGCSHSRSPSALRRLAA